MTRLECISFLLSHLSNPLCEAKEALIEVQIEKLVANCTHELHETIAVGSLLHSLLQGGGKLGELAPDDREGDEELEDGVLDHVGQHANTYFK